MSSNPQKRKIVESDSDDDMPLSELRNKVTADHKKPSSTTVVAKKAGTAIAKPTASPSTSISGTPSVVIKKEVKVAKVVEASDSDSDDDVPIAVLMKRKQDAALAARASSAPPAKKNKVVETQKVTVKKESSSSSSSSSSTAEIKKKVAPTQKKPPSTSSSSSSSSSSSGGKKIQGDPFESSYVTDLYYNNLDKGKLCQHLLRRWWYAMSWPQEGVMELCPRGYEPLIGFPGVFVGTTTNFIGNIVDKRDQDTCPNLRNFSRKSSAELQKLCVAAYEGQIQQLAEAEGAGSKLERVLKRELQEIKNIKPDKADKQAEKLLKQPF